MRPAEDIKRLVENLSDKTSAQMDQRVREDMLRALAESERPSALTRPKIGRTIMKSPITKLAAAAVIIGAVALSIAVVDKVTSPAYALEQTVEALQNVRFLHIVGRDETGRINDERWIEIGMDGFQIRYRQQNPPSVIEKYPSAPSMVIEDGESTAVYRQDKKTVIIYDRKDQQYQWVGKLRKAFENLRQEGKILKENDEYQGRVAHKVWWPYLSAECYVDPETKLPMIVGDSELRYDEPPAGTFDIVTPEGYTVVDMRPGTTGLLPDWLLEEESSRDNMHNYFGQARQALVDSNYAEAARQFECAVAQDPMSNWAWFWLGIAYYGQGRYDLAVERFSVVLEMFGSQPRHYYCNYARGLAYAQMGQQEQAKADWLICLPMMIRALRIPSAGFMFEYADSPLVSCGEYEPSDQEIVVKMINRLRLITGQNFGYDPNGAPEQKEAAIAAWEQWFNSGGQIQFTPEADLLPVSAIRKP